MLKLNPYSKQVQPQQGAQAMVSQVSSISKDGDFIALLGNLWQCLVTLKNTLKKKPNQTTPKITQ